MSRRDPQRSSSSRNSGLNQRILTLEYNLGEEERDFPSSRYPEHEFKRILCTGGAYYVLYTALLISKLFWTEGLYLFFMALILNGFEACNIYYSGHCKKSHNGCCTSQNHYVLHHINNRYINSYFLSLTLFSWSEKRGLISDIACFPAEISPICTKVEAGKSSPFNFNWKKKKVLVAVWFNLLVHDTYYKKMILIYITAHGMRRLKVVWKLAYSEWSWWHSPNTCKSRTHVSRISGSNSAKYLNIPSNKHYYDRIHTDHAIQHDGVATGSLHIWDFCVHNPSLLRSNLAQ